MTLAEDHVACPSCGKTDVADGRYCIYCGSILRPVYCSNCGTLNPEDLEQCLECGNRIPRLTSVQWGPIPPVIQQTPVPVEEAAHTDSESTVAVSAQSDSRRKSLLSRLRSRLKLAKSRD